MASDERRMTFIIVPHGGRDLSTRSFEVSYRRLRIVGILLLLAVVAWLAMAASWLVVAAQAARVPVLEREIDGLQDERARVVQLADALRRLEGQYDQVRRMLGADRVPAPPSASPSPPDSAGEP
jgi:hypothetical protein